MNTEQRTALNLLNKANASEGEILWVSPSLALAINEFGVWLNGKRIPRIQKEALLVAGLEALYSNGAESYRQVKEICESQIKKGL
jgi:hypothetical protein